jgi:hypothetical protein
MTSRQSVMVRSQSLPNEPQSCPQADATMALASEVRKLRMTVAVGLRQAQPALRSVKCAGDRAETTAKWLKKWGPWLLASGPGVLVAVGAISPNAANALKVFLAGFGG